ncbi:MAG: alpha/beta hydrolase [bacterium]
MYPRYLVNAPEEMPGDMQDIEKVWLNTSFGQIEAWFFPASSPKLTNPSPVVIFAHGNGEIIDFWPMELKKFTQLGIGLFLVEYPGYGRSQGTPSQKTITETFIKAYDYLIERNDVDASRVILFGRSLGGGAVCTLAAERASAALILMSAFTNTRSFAIKFLVPGFIVRDPFDNLSVVRSYNGPVLIIHGKHDNIVPYRHAVLLHRAAPDSKMITYECSHNDCPPNWDTFWNDVESFLRDSGII